MGAVMGEEAGGEQESVHRSWYTLLRYLDLLPVVTGS